MKFVGKSEPPATEATAEIMRAAQRGEVVFAVIETEKGRTIYCDLDPEAANDLFDWLESGLLEALRQDLTKPGGGIQ